MLSSALRFIFKSDIDTSNLFSRNPCGTPLLVLRFEFEILQRMFVATFLALISSYCLFINQNRKNQTIYRYTRHQRHTRCSVKCGSPTDAIPTQRQTRRTLIYDIDTVRIMGFVKSWKRFISDTAAMGSHPKSGRVKYVNAIKLMLQNWNLVNNNNNE